MTLNHIARRLALGVAVALPLALTVSTSAQAQAFFRIGTGGTAGTYYPVGGMIANAVSVPGKLIATAQATNGSVANVNGVASGAMESGFSQSDVATWAQKGTGIYEGKPNIPDLRLIANLYPETIHVVVKKSSGIKSIAELKGKRVALDEPGSGTLVNARLILAAYNIKESEIKPEYIKPNQAADKMKDGALDAFFFVGGAPAATYKDVDAVNTLSVGAQWVTSAKADTETIYQITKALYSESTQKALAAGHAKGKLITLKNAVQGAGIPFHPGAEKFYREAGVLK